MALNYNLSVTHSGTVRNSLVFSLENLELSTENDKYSRAIAMAMVKELSD